MKSLKDMGNEYTEIYNKTINVFPVKIMTYTIYNQGMNFIEKEKRPRH